MKKSYGEKAAQDYFNLTVKSYKKFIAVFWFMKGKREVFKAKLNTAKSLRKAYMEKKQ